MTMAIIVVMTTRMIATVDKFAQMPWKGEVQMLFGQVNGFCSRHGFKSPDTSNMELGTLIRGGSLPQKVEAQFDKLIQTEILVRV